MSRYVLRLEEIEGAQVALAGGKGAGLGELSRMEGVRVPAGFCVTTEAFDRILADAPSIDDRLDRLSRIAPDDREGIRALSAEIRRAIEGTPLPVDLASAITEAVSRLGDPFAFAVRASATAEDLPTASVAGQQESYLNVVGSAAVLAHVSRCWASLFTERAVTYRGRNGFDHRKVHMAVVVQRMVLAQASGVLFTADPVTSNRTIAAVEAGRGLGEALVSGRMNPDLYRVRDGVVVAQVPAGREPALTDAQVVELVRLGRTLEARFGRPQDIEWCLADGAFAIVQSRAITTLFPVPAAADGGNHVYISVGHQQMMTDAMKPLGLSLWQLTTARPMHEAGGRLFVDITRELSSPATRAAFLALAGKSDALLRDALQTLLDRGDFVPSLADPAPGGARPADAPAPIPTDGAIVAELVARNEASVAALKRDIASKSGPALLDFVLEDLEELRRLLFDPRNHQAIMAGMEATWWLNDQLAAWLGEKNAADTLTRSVPGNVTSEMGLALLDVADVVRRHPAVVDLLRGAGGDDAFLDRLPGIDGGREARDAIGAYLDTYGMRCVGEIDVTRPRWSEQPSALVPMILGNVRNFEPGAGARRFEQGMKAAAEKEAELLARLRTLPDGESKAEETRRRIERVRTFAGYREYPKYG
ncbi:MAG: phosphoenolpyruvate synthase, partial [Polyangiaceae bacterium]